MAMLSVKQFGGIAPKIPARYLPDNNAQTAVNVGSLNTSLQPLQTVGSTVHTLTKVGVPQTIYRFGQDTQSDSLYWFHWTQDVDVARSQIPGDASEWTFYTGDGAPKATYNSLALSGANYPSVSRPLGLPAPSLPASASADTFTADDYPAEVFLTSAHVSQLSTTYGILISTTTDDAAEYTTITLTGTITAASVVSAINAVLSADVTATPDEGGVLIETVATGASAKLFVKFQTGTTYNTEGTFTYDATPNLSATGTSDSSPYLILLDSEIGSISSGDKIYLASNSGVVINNIAVSSTHTAATFAPWLTSRMSGQLVATAYGSCVIITPGTQGSGANGSIEYKRTVGSTVRYSTKETGSESAAPARLFVTQSNVDDVEDSYLYINVNGVVDYLFVPDPSYVSYLTQLATYGLTVQLYGSVSPVAVVQTNSLGTGSSLQLRGGSFPSEAVYSLQSAEGYADQDETPETRVYTYTWVNKESGFEFESAPAAPSNEVAVVSGQSVTLSGLASVPGGDYVVTHRRIYRSVTGTYLYVGEIEASQAVFTDNVDPEDLGEELLSLTWAEPPATLKGLTNLPNGIMAGFTGRDVYMCDPYHPHAWPVEYINSIDYPIVGLGRMDTTLAVLTTGTPYFIQGSHPDSMAVVKSDIEQACVSKRSIVSMGGVVIYASPDGLIALAPSGSKNLTDTMFTHDQWQTFVPSSIHGYHQDGKYIGFYDTGSAQGGFMYDLQSGQFILHSLYAEAGYTDIQRDELFLAFDDRTVKKWLDGSFLSYTWKSKKFTLPQIMSFACAQLEAETYPVTMKVYADGSLIHTQTVANRNPFRLPAVAGRDWEVQLEGSSEVFSMAVAQSMSEIAGG